MKLLLIRHAPAVPNGSVGIRARSTAEIAAAAFQLRWFVKPRILRSLGGA